MDTSMKEIVREHLRDNRGRLPFIASETGIPYSSIMNILSARENNPGINNIQILYDYFKDK